ncbi:hypothetical protein lerEdw1_014029 [Lerista edwardsae]|nr:hypothetical protein lerEdw1_014029 [Lerista edwardsae]
MFFLLGHLACLDLCMSSFVTSRVLFDFLVQHQTITFQGCMAQIFLLHLFGGSEMLLLMAMAYDRYVAICHPLRYASLMSRHRRMGLVLASWAGGVLHSCVQLAFIINVPFCGPNHLDSFFSDIPSVVRLACVDIYPLQVMLMTNSGIMSLVCFLNILLSYGLILSAVHARAPSERTSKVVSTCTSHFLMVTMYFGPCIFIYLCLYTHFRIDKLLSIFHITIIPLLNPFTYALKNGEMKAIRGYQGVVRKMFWTDFGSDSHHSSRRAGLLDAEEESSSRP